MRVPSRGLSSGSFEGGFNFDFLEIGKLFR